MPQSERSEIIKQFLKWLKAKSKHGGATLGECVRHLQIEITEMGAQERTCREYIKDMERTGLIYIDGLKWKCTEVCENWLRRKVS